MTYSSTVPAAITALVTALRTSTALGLAGVQILDGPVLTEAAGTETVAVGYTGDQNQAAVTGTAAIEGMGGIQDRERYTVSCAAEVINPGGDLPAARTRAYALHAACGAAIGVDRTLGKVVMQASLGAGSLTQQQTSQGARALVTFPVSIDAYTTR